MIDIIYEWYDIEMNGKNNWVDIATWKLHPEFRDKYLKSIQRKCTVCNCVTLARG